jgi:hypothetical protein
VNGADDVIGKEVMVKDESSRHPYAEAAYADGGFLIPPRSTCSAIQL